MRKLILIILVVMFVCFAAGCKDIVIDSPAGFAAPGMWIDEQIVLDESDPIYPMEIRGDTCFFDLSDVDLVSSGNFNEFEVKYQTGSSCDRDTWILNCSTAEWDQIGFDPPPNVMCAMVISTQGHILSSLGFEAGDYVDATYMLKLLKSRSAVIRALVLNPDYYPLALRFGGSGVTVDGEELVVSSRTKIYRLSFHGELIAQYEPVSKYPFGLAFDGEYFWLADGTDRIIKLDGSMNIVSDFSVPTDFPGGLGWAMDRLWLTEYHGGASRTFVIDPEGSCASGSAVVDTTYQTPGGGANGIAFDGTHLLILSDRLYKMTPAGGVVASYEHPVRYASDIAWGDGALWIINRGPAELRCGDRVVSRFRVPVE